MPRTKKTSTNAVKKIDKQLDSLLKEKKEMEDIPIISRVEIEKKANELDSVTKKSTSKKTSTKKTTTKKASATKKTTTKKSTTKKATKVKDEVLVSDIDKTNKKEDIVIVEEIKKIPKKKTTKKKSVTVKKSEKEKLKKNNKKEEVSESTLKLDKLSEELRNIYESDDLIEIEDKKIRKKKSKVDKFIILDEPLKDKTGPIDIIRPENYEVETLGYKIIRVIAIILGVIFTLMLIAFIAFIIYVCTY